VILNLMLISNYGVYIPVYFYEFCVVLLLPGSCFLEGSSNASSYNVDICVHPRPVTFPDMLLQS